MRPFFNSWAVFHFFALAAILWLELGRAIATENDAYLHFEILLAVGFFHMRHTEKPMVKICISRCYFRVKTGNSVGGSVSPHLQSEAWLNSDGSSSVLV